MNRFLSGLFWLLITALLPLALVGLLLLGAKGDSASLLRATSGIFAYVWMLAALFLAGRPTWLDAPSALLGQGSLILAGLPLGLSHAATSPTLGWTSTTGKLALVVLVATSLYTLLFYLASHITHLPIGSNLVTWLNRANALACGLVFIHVQLIPSIRHNLLFMLPFYFLTALAFLSYFREKADASTEATTEQTELA